MTPTRRLMPPRDFCELAGLLPCDFSVFVASLAMSLVAREVGIRILMFGIGTLALTGLSVNIASVIGVEFCSGLKMNLLVR